MSENLDDALGQQQQQQHQQKQYFMNNLNIILKMQEAIVDYYETFPVKSTLKTISKTFFNILNQNALFCIVFLLYS